MNKKRIYPQWFLILPLALYIIFFLLPSVMGVGYSFTDWNSRSVLNGTHFVGLQNFAEIFTSDKSYLSGIGNTRVGIIMVFTSAMIPFCVFTIRNFVISVPVELDEAAVIDGAGPLSLFFKIIMPLLKPTMVTCFILQFMTVWSDFLTPLYLSSKSRLFPMTMAVYQFFGKNKSYWNYIFADIVLTCIPVIIVYMIGQKYIVGGMTSGAVKE